MDAQVKRIADNIEKAIKEQFLQKPSVEDVRKSIKDSIERIMVAHMKEKCGFHDQIQIDVSGEDNKVILSAKNLFTLLLMNGHFVDPGILGEATEWNVELGTYRYEYNHVSNKHYNYFYPGGRFTKTARSL